MAIEIKEFVGFNPEIKEANKVSKCGGKKKSTKTTKKKK